MRYKQVSVINSNNLAYTIPESWEIKKLKYVTKVIIDGTHFTPTYKATGIPFLRVTDIQNGHIDLNSVKFIPEEEHLELIKRCYPEKGDLLLSKNGTVGITKVVDWEFPFSIFVSLCLIKVNEKLNPYFLSYFFQSHIVDEQIYGSSKKTSVQNLHLDKIRELMTVVPSIKEQVLIVKFLNQKTSQIDSLIEKKKRLIELLKEYRTAIINHAVTKGLDPNVKMKDSGIEWIGEIPEHWEVLKIKHLSPVARGASPRPIDDPKYFDDDGEYSWVRISDVTASNRYLLSTRQKLSILGSSLSVKLKAGDFFLSIAGSVGKPIITKINCCIHDGFVWFPKLRFNNEFLYYIFETGEPYKGLGKLGTQLNLNTETVGDIHIPVPPDSEIEEIVSFLDHKVSNILKTTDALLREVDSLLEFRTSLISDAVTGKIDVRDYAERVSEPGVT